MEKKIQILPFIVLLVVFFLSFLSCAKNYEKLAVKGILDLSSDPERLDNISTLNGEWEFYWSRLINPDELKSPPSAYMSLPGIWNGMDVDGKILDGFGYATYRLKVLLPSSGFYGLKIKETDCAFKLWINGADAGGAGIVGKTASETIPNWERKEFYFYTNQDLELVMQISNFSHRKGGPEEIFTIGSSGAISRAKMMMVALDVFITGGLLIMGLYHLFLYTLRRKEKAYAYFAILCVAILIRALFSNEKMALTAFSFLPWIASIKIEYLSLFMILPLIIRFFSLNYPECDIKPLSGIFYIIALLASLVTLFTPPIIFTWTILFVQATGLLGMIYCVSIIWRAILNEYLGTKAVMVGLIILILASVTDIFYTFGIFLLPFHILPLGFFCLVIIQAFTLAGRFNRSITTNEVISDRLQKINESLSRFVPVEFLRFLGKSSLHEINVGDHVNQEMAILFADIRGYTSLSEKLSPDENFKFLDSYLRRITPLITQHNGFIDKFIGDGIMALFPEKADDAVAAAIAIQTELALYNKELEAENYPQIKIGIGVHWGSMVLGTIGNSERMEPTVVSDAVNLASRIETLTKLYQASIIISQDVFLNLDNPTIYQFRFLGSAKAKGRNLPVPIYEIYQTEPEAIKDLYNRTHRDFELGLSAYLTNQIESAYTSFKNVLKVNPNDQAAKVFISLIQKAYVK